MSWLLLAVMVCVLTGCVVTRPSASESHVDIAVGTAISGITSAELSEIHAFFEFIYSDMQRGRSRLAAATGRRQLILRGC